MKPSDSQINLKTFKQTALADSLVEDYIGRSQYKLKVSTEAS